jgi:hypothetical protein
MRSTAVILLLPFVTACQVLFPTPIDQHTETGNPAKAVRTVGATYNEGEFLEAQLSLDGVVAGKGSLRVGKRCIADGKLALPVTTESGSSGLLSLLSDASAETWGLIDLDTNAPLEGRWDITNGEKRSLMEMDYRSGGYRVHQIRYEPEKDPKHVRRRVDLPIEQVPHDAHSFLGYLRRWEPADGERGYLYVTVGRGLYRADMVFAGRDAIATPQGSQEAFRIDGVATRISDKTLQNVARGERQFSLWISADDRRAPLRIVIETDITKISVDLTKYSKDAIAAGDPAACEDRVDRAQLDKAKGKKKKQAPASQGPASKDADDAEDADLTKKQKEAIEKLRSRMLKLKADGD